MKVLQTQLLIIGAGPAGYVCGIRAGQLGLSTVVVEQRKPGGTCLNVGCIPSKALIHAANEFHTVREFSHQGDGVSASGISVQEARIDLAKTMQWKDGIVGQLNAGVSGLLKKSGVQLMQGDARFEDGKTVVVTENGVETRIHADNIVIATGSEPVELSDLPFNDSVVSSTDALSFNEIPAQLAVVGGGYIGLELGTSFAKLGSKVTVVESEDRLLPQYDAELTAPVLDRLQLLGVSVLTHTQAIAFSESDHMLTVKESDQERKIPADKVLVTVGRRARLTGWGLTELSLTTKDGFVDIDEHCQTSMRGVFAIGDITGEPMLAHRAMAQGELVARHLAGQNVSWDKQCIPAVCFTDPEIVTAGLSPDQATEQQLAPKVTTFPFTANGRALSLQRDDGFVRVVSQQETNVVLGLQAVGAGVSELSAAFSLAIEMGALVDDIAATIHAHPTLSEGLQEACLKALGTALHN